MSSRTRRKLQIVECLHELTKAPHGNLEHVHGKPRNGRVMFGCFRAGAALSVRTRVAAALAAPHRKRATGHRLARTATELGVARAASGAGASGGFGKRWAAPVTPCARAGVAIGGGAAGCGVGGAASVTPTSRGPSARGGAV